MALVLHYQRYAMKKIVLILLFTATIHAQEHNIWYFGSFAGLDFNGGAPVPLTDGQINTIEGVASIADNNGQLLFYTDGVTIWNKSHQVMQNGSGLLGNQSSTQGAIIIPQPGNPHLYYLFTVTAEGGSDGCRYSKIDMAADNGLGAVTDKNILAQTPVAESITATWHNNGEDIWVVVRSSNLNILSAHLVTASGVSANPVNSTSVLLPGSSHGSIKISPDGSKLALCRGVMPNGTQLFDFNNITGVISNPVYLTSEHGNYGIEFSASGNMLYVSNGNILRQYDLTASDINASGITIYTGQTVSIGSLQRGPDDKIYAAVRNHNYLGVIHNPELSGTACNFVPLGIGLGGTDFARLSTSGLPNTVLSPVFKINLSTQVLCIGEEAVFSISPVTGQFESILWEFGDGNTSGLPNPTHIFQHPGTYLVTLTAHRQGITKVAQATIIVAPNPEISQPPNLELCDEGGNGTGLFNLESQNTVITGNHNPDDYFITYHLTLEQAQLNTYSVPAQFTNTTNPQTIYVRMESKESGCYGTASFEIAVRPKPVIDMPDSYALCRGSIITIEAPEGFEAYNWSTGQNNRAIVIDHAGTYTLTVALSVNGMRCENSKVLTVYEAGPPVIRSVITSDWTASNNSITVLVSGEGDYEYSVNGVTYQQSPQFENLESGPYTVHVRDKNGCGNDSKDITLLMYVKYFTPNGDGINDTWRIPYSWNEPGLVVYIFDRYGKHLASFKGNSPGWDGTINGQNLPATDYWFVVERNDGRTHKGHFAMVR
jgi:gliding motility-associated-like protein